MPDLVEKVLPRIPLGRPFCRAVKHSAEFRKKRQECTTRFNGGAIKDPTLPRCQYTNARTGQCGTRVKKGETHCYLHRGKRKKKELRDAQSGWESMPSLYSKHIGPTLAAKVEEMTQVPVGEQLNLYDELALARGMLCQALDLQKRIEAKEASGQEVSIGGKAAAQQMVRDALDGVTDLVDKIVKIEKSMEGAMSVTQLSFFVAQLTSLIYGVLGKDHLDLAQRLHESIRDNLRLPGSDNGGVGRDSINIRATMDDLPV